MSVISADWHNFSSEKVRVIDVVYGDKSGGKINVRIAELMTESFRTPFTTM